MSMYHTRVTTQGPSSSAGSHSRCTIRTVLDDDDSFGQWGVASTSVPAVMCCHPLFRLMRTPHSLLFFWSIMLSLPFQRLQALKSTSTACNPGRTRPTLNYINGHHSPFLQQGHPLHQRSQCQSLRQLFQPSETPAPCSRLRFVARMLSPTQVLQWQQQNSHNYSQHTETWVRKLNCTCPVKSSN